MPHVILLGDSIFDNGAYTEGGPTVIAQVRERLPRDWRATLNAVDGSTTEDIAEQLQELPSDATHLVLSVGGNNALLRADILDAAINSSAAALLLLAAAANDFEMAYQKMVAACMSYGLPLIVCTIYNGNFPEPAYQQCVATALSVFNDVILRSSVERQIRVIELRLICNSAADYANPIEPSSIGGAKIAEAIVAAVTASAWTGRGAQIVAS